VPSSMSGGGARIAGWCKVFIAAGTVLGLAVVFVLLFNQKGLYKIYCLRQKRDRLERTVARLAEENARLARIIDRLQRDPVMIQDVIRRELHFVKKNEIIIQLPNRAGKPTVAGVLGPYEAPVPAKPPAASPRRQAPKSFLARRRP